MLSKFWDARTARVLFTALTFVVILGFLDGARGTLTLFFLSILFAYLLNPLVTHLQHPLHGRIKAIAAVYVALTGVLVLLGFLLGPRIAEESKSLMMSLPTLANRMASGQFIQTIGKDRGWDEMRRVQIQHFFIAHRQQLLNYASSLADRLAAPAAHIWWLILIPILGFFFLKDASAITDSFVRMSHKPDTRSTVEGITEDVNIMLGSYIRAQLILAALTGVVLTAVFGLMRVPYIYTLGPLAGLCEFIPVVGPAVAAVGIFLIALLAGYNHMIWVFLLLGTWRVLQDYVNAPRIMGKSVEISPLAEIFAVLAGGEIAGVVGALISVPVLALLRILWQRLRSGRDLDVPAVNSLPPSHSLSGPDTPPRTDPAHPAAPLAHPTPQEIHT